MNERGESLGPVKALGGAPGLGLRARFGERRRSLERAAVRQPNRRVQRTRSSPSAHRSPLTRYPLGSRGAREQGGDFSLAPVEFRTGEMILVS